jgi:uncharacterized membrane protein YjjP (DUF1212 family)
MYFGGRREILLAAGSFGRITLNPYDLIVAGIALLLCLFFIITAVRESIRMAKANR